MDENLTQEADEEKSQGYALYTLQQIAFATIFGSPVAGFFFISRNSIHLRGTWTPLIWGVLSTLAVMALKLFLPKSIPRLLVIGPGIIFTLCYAQACQMEAIERHLQSGGREGSWGTVVGITLLIFAGIFAALIIIISIINILVTVMPGESEH